MSHTQQYSTPRRGSAVVLLVVPALVGGAIATALGVYGELHPPTGFAVGPGGFTGPLAMKAWLTTGAALLAILQVLTAMAMWGKLPFEGAWVEPTHRWSGRIAFLLTVPVAFHCLYAVGARYDEPRVMIHSILGCLFYGIFATKMLALPKRGVPGWTLPVLGGLLFTLLVGLWLTSSFWFFTTIGVQF
ncbi:DUF6529 family protein [Acrocarpospora macrocephala]|uniref:Uncharacterized protein n=1 Tax=Acrocarpospora macrocephala TaxID=150177 RepID=A0A5M3X1T4_9ACTN|nr:DUF6529 family protein [Acrocarpospora macrocephala]GES14552.1 hypothetical protein Amac_081490 [Acrocarpospora macrocephala]